ncbi:glycosyltransferase family 4 protein [Neobacillus kokaensis]|uniref:Glycoside hydrolase n=1 Tax=Neobacillus kokaensis TaxID=2759023 RepID=A0ABQ3MXN6_9BACI|nr:glycosyltransferase family 4 protein [Neobacillus kokaensis]GHH96999.1 hypothetical protein AM1BK_05420 [Neobacillus kokaensis]
MANAVSEKINLSQGLVHKQKLNILLLSWEYPPNVVGGLSRHVFGLAVHLAHEGHVVHVLSAGNGVLPEYERADGVHVHRVKPINDHDDHFLTWIGGLNLAMAFKGEQLADEVKFDLIHAHDWLVGTAAFALKEVTGIPLLSTIHATEHGRNNGIHTEIQQFIHDKEQSLIESSDQIIVCSYFMKESLMSIFQVEEKKLAVIPNGIEPPYIEGKAAAVFSDLPKRKYIFSIGRIVKEKGFETIIKAAEIAMEKGQKFLFIIAGKGPMLDIYRRQVEERKLGEYVVFIGYITDKERDVLIQGCEMMVIPSLYEPFGIVALEGMIQEKPVIVSNAGGIKGIVRHLQTGLLINPGDAESLLEQISFLTINAKVANEIGKNGGRAARSLYGWRRIAADTSRVMEDTILNSRVNINGIT